MRTIDWEDGAVVLVDQTRLPEELVSLRITDNDDLIAAIRRLSVRGAPAIGAAGALGVALAARRHGDDAAAVRRDAEELRRARPTAVNLAWAVDRVLARLDEGADAVLAEALAILDEDEAANRRIGELGASFLGDLGLDRVAVLTHCNAGALATVGWGTALGVGRQLHAEDRLREAYATETRPLLQGARLTAWELDQLGVPHHVVVDSAAASVLAQGRVDAVVVGADRVAADGHVANKIGTYPIALAAHRAGVPMIVAAPESTLDLDTPTGSDIEIEVRDDEEVVAYRGLRSAPPGTPGLNLAFDVTPPDLVTAIVTERRVIRTSAGGRPDATA